MRAQGALLLVAALGQGPLPTAVEPLAFECHRVDAGGRTPFGVIVADWNGDGRPDLAVSNAGTSTVSILLGTGKGRFSIVTRLPVGEIPRPLAAADLDGDGNLDLAVGHAIPNSTWIFRGDGRGGFEPNGRYTSGENPFDVELVDVDLDGHLDLLIANESNAPHSALEGRIAIHPGLGDATFGRPTILHAGRFPAALEVADFDGKPGVDLAVANWGSDSVSLFFRKGTGFVAGPSIELRRDNPYSLIAADLDGDGASDLALTDLHGKVQVLYGSGSGEFSPGSPRRVGRGTRWVTAADLDGNGRLDLVTADSGQDQVSILRNRGARRFARAQAVPVGKHPRMAQAADLDGDGRLDLVVTNEQEDDLGVLLQRSPGQGRPCPSKSK